MEEEEKKKKKKKRSNKEEAMTMITGKRQRRTVNNDEEEKLRPWSDLPQELLELIKKRILFADQQSFPAVCKSWNTIGIFPPAKQIPWLIVFDETETNTCKLVDPTTKKTYTIDMKAIKKKKKIKDFNTMKVHESKYGWLLISSQYNQFPHSTTRSLFLYSPFYKEENNVIELPVLNHSNICFATFTSHPLKEDCKFYTITRTHSQDSGVMISTFCPGDKTWCSGRYSYAKVSLAEVECWTYSEGVFYWASRNVVGKLDLNRDGRIFYKPPPISITRYNGGKLHILKSDGEEFFLILERNLEISNKKLCHFVTNIYRLDLSLRKMKRVDRIGDRRVLFIGDGYNCVSKIYGEPEGVSYRLYYCSGLELKFCCVDGVLFHRRSYNCFGHYGSIATKKCRKLLIDPPSLPITKWKSNHSGDDQ